MFVTPELSLGRVEACFPLAGCLAYRGFHDKAHAQAEAKLPREMGFDVDIGGVPAYSTLGWVGDPEPSTMMSWSDANLVGTVFHELDRQRVYVNDDTTFNESYARFVEQEGLRHFLAGGRIAAVEPEAEKRREAQLVALVIATRERLADVYSLPLLPKAMREHKAEPSRSCPSTTNRCAIANGAARATTTAGSLASSTTRPCCPWACTTSGCRPSPPCSGKPRLTPEMIAKAISIADSRCRSDIDVMGIEVTGCPGHYGLTTSMGIPTRALSHASRTLQESIAWLRARIGDGPRRRARRDGRIAPRPV